MTYETSNFSLRSGLKPNITIDKVRSDRACGCCLGSV
jgi:hypothetical protein